MNFERWLGFGLAAMIVTACAAKTTTGSSTNDLQQAAKGDAGAASCVPEACGPKPLGVEVLCSDGSTAGVTGRCIAAEDGSCGWEITECPQPADAGSSDSGPTDPCLGDELPACPRECAAFPMSGACTNGDACRLAGSKIGDECQCDASGTWSCSPHPPLGMGCNRVCN